MSARTKAWTLADKSPPAELSVGPLFDARPLPPPSTLPRLEREFLAFHAANPHVLSEVIRLALALKERGITAGAIGLVWEELRRVQPVDTARAPGEFRLNDHYRAFYARLAMHREPRLSGYFELRKQRVPFDPASVP